MNRLTLIAAMVLAPLAACHSASKEQPPLAGARLGGPFTLTDQDGKSVSDARFAGKYRIMYFGYTYCPDVCPLDVQNIAAGLRQVEKQDPAKGAKIVPIFVSVDPERDTPPVLKQFVSAFHPRLVGLTGSPEAIAAVAKEYAIFYQKQAPGEDAEGYLVNHSRQAYLINPDGKPLALLPADESADAVAASLEKWVE